MSRLFGFLVVLSVLGLACGDAPFGPVGPGGRANRLIVEGPEGSIDFEALRSFAVKTETASVVTFTLEGVRATPPGATLALDLTLDLIRLEQSALPFDLDVAETSTAPRDAAFFRPLPIRRIRLVERCFGCAPSLGTQRFLGRFRLVHLDAERIEAWTDLSFSGWTSERASTEEALEIRAFLDSALP